MSTPGWAAMPFRSPLTRERPWVADGVWIAHEALTVFTHLAGTMPRNGRWKMTEHGPVHIGDSPLRLAEFVADALDRSEPCVVHHDAYQRTPSREEAVESAATRSQVVEVLDLDAQPWGFDHALVEVATLGQTRWSWRIAAGIRPGAALVGLDHKSRPRFVLACLTPKADE